jgi:hypothetical protein
MFGRHAAVAVTLARFVSFVRTLMPWFAGMTKMPYGRFLFWDLLGVLGWGIASVTAGYLAKESWHVLASVLGRASAFVVMVLIVIAIVAAWRSRHRAALGEEATEPDEVAGADGGERMGTDTPAMAPEEATGAAGEASAGRRAGDAPPEA